MCRAAASKARNAVNGGSFLTREAYHVPSFATAVRDQNRVAGLADPVWRATPGSDAAYDQMRDIAEMASEAKPLEGSAYLG
jgi:hypothetical protein